MGKIRIKQFDQLQACPADAEEYPSAGVSTIGVLNDGEDRIHARLHFMTPGSQLAWRDSSRGHLAYVWEGAVSAAGQRLAKGSMILTEHGASSSAIAEEDATLLVFNVSRTSPNLPSRAGGHVHLLPAADVPGTRDMSDKVNVGASLFADSNCKTCEIWLHETDFRDAGFVVEPHYHTEDEVIVVTGGEIVLGRQRYGRGTAISIPENTVYGFRTGPEGLRFINFRPGCPSYALSGNANPVDERQFYKMISPPRYRDGAVAS